jgi:hypothetical protein
MGNSDETRLRGKDLEGSERTAAPDHVKYAKKRNPDAEVQLDDEKDTLYNDGLDVEDDSLTLADTKGTRPPRG